MLTRDKNCAVGIMSKLTIQTNTKHRAASLRQLSFLLSCVSTRTRDIDIAILSVCLSVRPSVRNVPGLHENCLTYYRSFYRATRMHSADYAVATYLCDRLSVTRRYSA